MPPWYALLAPAVPLVLALGFELTIIPSLLAGVLYALVTTTRPGEMNKRLLRTLYGGFEVAAPPIALFVAIGILLAAVKLPGAMDALEPLVKAVSPQNAVLFVLVFTLLVPLCLHRGPLNVFGLGAGIAGVLIATGIYPAAVVEIIFPCVRGVYDKLSSPLGRYYLYYAPHHAPGGICLAYGNSLAGPFTECPSNPIVANKWSPHYSVSHVSSPHVLWNQDAKEFWLYFHGENRHDPPRPLGRRDPLHLRQGRPVDVHAPGGHHGDVVRPGLPPRPALARRPLRDGLHAEQHHQSP
ncbi:hypothetical protein SAMN05216482_1067 [Streptomyces sp. PAN_FS17]|nr:hypothetical protein SAMN05216482_1067 [Streptomyces sp. PAN_FS17]